MSKLPVKKFDLLFTRRGMADGLRPVFLYKMSRRPHAHLRPDVKAPHPWAFLAEWREHCGMTQEQVGEKFQISNVTVHRWESGKAPVSVKNFFRLAELYKASQPSDLMFPVSERSEASAMASAWNIINGLPPEQRAQWLALGETLRRAAARIDQETPPPEPPKG